MKQHNVSKIIRALVIAEMLLLILLAAPSTTMSQDIGAITYREGTQPQRIYAFVGGG